jgi:hypothetical protein
MKQSDLMTIKFKEEITQREIPLLRGAIIHSMKDESPLFHNHLKEDHLRYSYPLIQYKTIQRRAAMVCLNEGTEAIGDFFSANPKEVHLGDRLVRLEIDSIDAKNIEIACSDTLTRYLIRRWMPLNQANYRTYQTLEGMLEQIDFLERMLTANILSFLKGIGIHVDTKIEVKILQLHKLRGMIFKGVKMECFDAVFKTNITLPDFIGLGKGASLGFGTLFRMEKKSQDQKEAVKKEEVGSCQKF